MSDDQRAFLSFLGCIVLALAIGIGLGLLTGCQSSTARVVNPHCTPERTIQTGAYMGFCDKRNI